MQKFVNILACLSMAASAIKEQLKDGSYYESPIDSTRHDADYSYGPSPMKLYYDYRYGEHYG